MDIVVIWQKTLMIVLLLPKYCSNTTEYLNRAHLFFKKRVILIDCMISWSLFLDVTRMSMSTVSFLGKADSGILCL